jgi:uncharacterized protein YecE (DUF72 family)
MAEVATSYRFPPTPEVARRWAASSPPGFTFDVRAWSLLSGAPTWPESLWPDLQSYVKPPSRPTTKLYRHHLPPDVVDECWERFRHALGPLRGSGRLGAVVVRYPSWFRPGPSAWQELAELPARLEGCRVAVELDNRRWLEGHACEEALTFLEGLGLCFVCKARPGRALSVVAATSDLALLRFEGRAGPPQGAPWHLPVDDGARVPDGTGTAREGAEGSEAEGRGSRATDGAAWWAYRYSDGELASWVPAVRDLASGSSEVHVVMDNCWRSDAVDNALRMLELVAGT